MADQNMSPNPLTESHDKVVAKLVDNAPALLEMLENYQRAGWLGRLIWKTMIAIGLAVGAIATFKDHLMSLLGMKGG